MKPGGLAARMSLRSALLLALLCLASAAVPVPVLAHNTYEASELETHVVNDEGTDVLESYGGYDIQDLFVGFAHDATTGSGAAGDGLYVRLELYGNRTESQVPQLAANWSVTVAMAVAGNLTVRSVWTTDGATFRSDFDSLAVATEERDTHVQRAFLSYANLGIAAGSEASILRIESRVDGDLRDVAPGGIPVPGTNGAQEYPDPTSIEGKGILVESFPLSAPSNYVQVTPVATAPGDYTITVKSALQKGAQHVFVDAIDEGTYELFGNTSAALDANGTMTFRLVLVPGRLDGAAHLDIRTDVGGRTPLVLTADGLQVEGGAFAPAMAPPEPESSPPAGLLLALGVLGLAGLVARRHKA